MKTEALEELIEHCKHIGGIPAMFLKERIIVAEEELKDIRAAQHGVQPTLLTRCPKCNAGTGWHHPLCEDYSPESQSG